LGPLRAATLAVSCLSAAIGGSDPVGAATLDWTAPTRVRQDVSPPLPVPKDRRSESPAVAEDIRIEELLWSVSCPADPGTTAAGGRAIACGAPFDLTAPRHSPRAALPAMPQAEATAVASVVLALFWAATFRLRRRRVSASSRSSAVRRSR